MNSSVRLDPYAALNAALHKNEKKKKKKKKKKKNKKKKEGIMYR